MKILSILKNPWMILLVLLIIIIVAYYVIKLAVFLLCLTIVLGAFFSTFSGPKKNIEKD